MKTVLITGANRGIGLGMVQHYLSEGWRVVGASRQGRDPEVFQALEERYAGQIVPVQLDVADEESIGGLKNMLPGSILDLVINNAGVCPKANLGEWTSASFMNGFRVNSIGPALVFQTVLPFLKDGAKVVNITSGMGSLELSINPDNGLDAYAMSKVALNMLSHRLAEKVRPRGIIVVSLNPGWVQTDMGGREAPNQVEDAVKDMTAVIEHLTLEQSGQCLAETGERLPW